jgi:hypothetical protein
MADAESSARERAERVDDLDTGVAHPARVYDYWLGGTNNFAADREAAERVLAVAPGLRFRVRASRAFLGRATRYLAAEAGIRQFLDIGTGIPAAGNTHEVAQRAAPDSRVVYVDNDPIVMLHSPRCAPGSRWPGSSPTSSWSSRAWCRCTSGGPTRARSSPRGPSPRTARWGARPAPKAHH